MQLKSKLDNYIQKKKDEIIEQEYKDTLCTIIKGFTKVSDVQLRVQLYKDVVSSMEEHFRLELERLSSETLAIKGIVKE